MQKQRKKVPADGGRKRATWALVIGFMAMLFMSTGGSPENNDERGTERQNAIAECKEKVLAAFNDYGSARGNSKVNSTDFAAGALAKNAMEECNYSY